MNRIAGISTHLILLVLILSCSADAQEHSGSAKRLASGDHSLTLRVGNLDRRYIVHVPPKYNSRQPVPIVIMLHGGGGTARGAMRETGWAQKADKEGFLAVFPEATPPDQTKPSRFGTNGQAWNDGSGGFHSGERNIPDVAFINAMLDDLIARFNVDRRRIYATGFSNGASMAFRVGVDLSERIAAIAPVAGTLWIKQPKLDRPVSLFYVSGDADPLNPIEGGTPKMATGAAIRAAISRVKPPANEFIAAWARALGCQTEPKPAPASPGLTTAVYSRCRDAAAVRFTLIEGHGHIWPGGKNLLPEAMVGKPSDKFKATDAIWEFFQQHSRSERH
ncbi:MAG: PHB depolymerase family esterase [Kiritimatiellia bacterium]|jgi:polyhydroxybutyrate depolymerase